MILKVSQHIRTWAMMYTWVVYRRIIVRAQPSTSESGRWYSRVCGSNVASKEEHRKDESLE